MKRLFTLVLTIVVAATAAACSSPEFEKSDGLLTVSYDGARWVLVPDEDEYVVDGTVRSFYRKKSGPYAVFCGTMTVEYELSDEEFYQEFGDPGPVMDEIDDVVTGPCGQDLETFLRMRADTIVPLSDDKEVFRALATVKPGDEVYIEGRTATVDSVACEDKRVKKLSNIVLVSYAEINGEAYGY
jgi:hypothetical protein